MKRLVFAALAGAALLAAVQVCAAPATDLGPDGSTPLQRAVFSTDVAEVKRLLAAGADVKQPNAYGVTPMSLAAEIGNTALIQMLLAAGADVESPTGDGQTALMSVARTGNVEAAALLISRGAKVNAAEKFGGQTALMWAVARHHPGMVRLLASKGADVNARAIVRTFERHITVEQRYKNTHTGGLTPLLYAVRENSKACVEVLLEYKVNMLLPDPDGISPLTLAMMNGNWDLAKRFIDAGADVNHWDIYGQSPLHVAIENAYVNRPGMINLGTDKSPNSIDGKALVRILVEKGADPNQQLFFRPPKETGQVSSGSRGTTPFHRACAANDVELMKYLLAHGADIRLHTAHQETPMMLVINSRGREEEIISTLRFLKEAGADVNAVQKVMWITRNRGGTALHAATKKNYKKVMTELVTTLGADPDLKDEDGLTALDYAQSRGWLPALSTRPAPRTDLVKVLRDVGAKVELAKVPDWPGEFPAIGPPRGHESEILPL